MKTFFLTPAAGKRLIAKGAARHPLLQDALSGGTVVIVAGTTNAYLAVEVLEKIGEETEDFPFNRFFRGVNIPAGASLPSGEFPGDVVISKGRWLRKKTVFDVVNELSEGDLIVKGANALNLSSRQAGVLIGHERAGTVGVIMQAVAGRRVGLLIPVGLEKRVDTDLLHLAGVMNRPGGEGPRLFPLTGEVFTEIEAISLLTGAVAELVAAGGICGGEGGVCLSVYGGPEEMMQVEELMALVSSEPPFCKW